MCDEIRITSVAQFVEKLSSLNDLAGENKTRFFRGHHDKEYKLVPSIYRNTGLIQNEDKIIKEAFTYCADDFLPHETLFEKLTKLQHYDYATRLLDISSNALVALYFAVRDFSDAEKSEAIDDKKDGEVIVLDIPNESIKYDDSDTVAILSAVSLRDISFDINEYIKNMGSHQVLEILLSSRKILDYQKDLKVLSQSEENKKIIDGELNKIGLELNGFLSQKFNQELNVITKNFFNENIYITRLLNDVRKDKPYFLPMIDHNDFNQVLCVRAKPNNPRISRQQGAFLLFGINGNKGSQAEIKQEWINSSNKSRFIIDKASKQKIIAELAMLGISSQTLFPELDKRAKPIMDKYKI